jgi:2-methylisocitrate lyase-like PEP mutase family enzyme
MPKQTSRREFFQVAGAAATGLMAAHPSAAAAEPQTQSASRTSMGNRFRALLRGPEPVVCMGAHDVLAARLVEINGIPSIFIGGSTGASNGHALPDIGLVSTTELIEYAARIMANIDIPALVDADDAGGTPLDVYRNAKAFERAGAGGVMYEDRVRTERLKGITRVSPTTEMVDRIHAAKDASPEVLLVLRSEAISAKLSMDETLERGVAYAKAGADILFFAGMKIEDFPRAAETVGVPLYGSFYVPFSRIKEARIKLAVYTSNLRDIASGAVNNALMEFKATGMMANAQKNELPGNIQARLTRSQELSELSRKYNGGR